MGHRIVGSHLLYGGSSAANISLRFMPFAFLKLLNDRITAGCVVVVVCGGAKHIRGKFIADLFASVSSGLVFRGAT